jgi:hypothetical protein
MTEGLRVSDRQAAPFGYCSRAGDSYLPLFQRRLNIAARRYLADTPLALCVAADKYPRSAIVIGLGDA